MAFCDNNRGTCRSLLKYSVTVQTNRLILKQWTKRWKTVSSSKFQNKLNEVLCLRKKTFWLRYRVLCEIYIENYYINLQFLPKGLFEYYKGIISHSWKLSVYNHLTKHFKLAILYVKIFLLVCSVFIIQ